MVKENDVLYLKERLVEWRRDFHAHPEMGFQEFRTSSKIIEILTAHGITIIKNFSHTAVIAVIDSGRPGATIGIRCDMDALGMPDDKEVEYKSVNDGVCHACGHDAHTTIGLGTALYLNDHKDTFEGIVKVVFQPAEEGPAPGGAKGIIDSGYVNDVDYMIAPHCHPDMEVGVVGIRHGAMLASGDNFLVEVTGVGAHGAYYHQGKDSITTAMMIAESYKNVRAREIDPIKEVALSICAFSAGNIDVTNVMPTTASFSGTVRTLDNDVRDYIIERLEVLAKGIAELNGCTCEFTSSFVSPALITDEYLNQIFEESASESCENGSVFTMNVPEMGYDDFARFGQVCKSSFVYLGTKPESGHAMFHHPEWDINEDALTVGVAFMANVVSKIR